MIHINHKMTVIIRQHTCKHKSTFDIASVCAILISRANWQLPQCNWKSARFPLTRRRSERRTKKAARQQEWQRPKRINNSPTCFTNTWNVCTCVVVVLWVCVSGCGCATFPSQRQIAHNYKMQWKLIYHARNIYGHASNINFHLLSFWEVENSVVVAVENCFVQRIAEYKLEF